jgi:hypothetical protein
VPRRCAWLTRSGRPCTKTGIGNPPLCRTHRVQAEGGIEEDFTDGIVDRVLDHPTARGAFDRIAGSFDRVAQAIDDLSMGRVPWRKAQEGAPPPRPDGQARRPPSPPPKPNGLATAYTILGFKPGQKLTAEAVKDRRKELAKLFHPDRGGSTEAMQRVNVAAERILAALK